MRDNLDTVSDTRDIVAETYHFYKNLYTAETTDTSAEQEMLNTYTVPTLPEKDRIPCDEKLTESELHKALLSMENDKSPGNDGLTTNFYKHFWHILGTELTKIYNYAFEQGITICLPKTRRNHASLQKRRPHSPQELATSNSLHYGL